MDTNEFLRRLKQEIEKRPDLSVSSIAVKAGLSNSTVRRWFSGQSSPTMKRADAVCAVLGTTLERFMAPERDDDLCEIIDLWRQLTAEERRVLRATARATLASRDASAP